MGEAMTMRQVLMGVEERMRKAVADEAKRKRQMGMDESGEIWQMDESGSIGESVGMRKEVILMDETGGGG